MSHGEPFENALLGLLYARPRHGYELNGLFKPGGELFAVGRLAKSQLYALLKALGEGGYATVSEKGGGHGPTRKLYAITDAGRERFLSWARSPEQSIRGLRVGFVLRLHFISTLGLGGQAELMGLQAAVLRERLGELGKREPKTGTVEPWVLALQTDLLESALAWLARWRQSVPEGV